MTQPRANPMIKADLSGIPETLLWTLYYRAAEAGRPDAVLKDPLAIQLVNAIDYPFEQYFGRANPLQAQGQALRVRAFDEAVRRFLADYPDATVVALGEGLETQAWRVDNGQVRWLTVELGETAELRQRLLPGSPRKRIIAGTVLDDWWMEQVDTTHAVLITAQGLLMYFQPSDVHGLIERCAARFPGSSMLFDAVPTWFNRRTLNGKMVNVRGYQPPPMPWGVDPAEIDRLRSLPNIDEIEQLSLPSGRGFLFGRVMPLVCRVPALHRPPLGYLAPWRVFQLGFHPGS